ncbi:ferritin-like domain-containing protein [Oceanithermus sp.]
MKTTNLNKTLLGLAIGGLLLGVGLSIAQGGPPANRGGAYVASTAPISQEAKDALLEALTGPEGEYAAYAVYDAVIQEYGQIEPYLSIRQAEANHIAALQRQLDLYGIDYPKTNPYLGKIEAPGDLEAFAQAGVDAEIANVEMYDQLLAKVADYPNITRVFQNLRSASLNQHLPAFKAAAANGGSLAPAQMQQYLGARGKGARGNGGQAYGYGGYGKSRGMGAGRAARGGFGGRGRTQTHPRGGYYWNNVTPPSNSQ